MFIRLNLLIFGWQLRTSWPGFFSQLPEGPKESTIRDSDLRLFDTTANRGSALFLKRSLWNNSDGYAKEQDKRVWHQWIHMETT